MSTVWDKLDNPDLYDASGKAVAPLSNEGESGQSASPDPNAAAAAAGAGTETTTATPPSPQAAPAPAAPSAAPAEDKSGAAPAAAKPAEPAKPPPADTTAGKPPTADEEETALRQEFSKEGDKGDEWRIRAYRTGMDIKKKLAPVQERLDRIGSPDRVARGLDAVEAFAEPEAPIADAVAKMTALSSSRFQEFHDYVYTETLNAYPDQVATDLLSEDGKPVTVAEAKEALKLLRSGTAGQSTQPQSTASAQAPAAVDITKIEVPKPDDMTAQEWEDFKLDYPGAYKNMQKQIADAQKAAAPAPAEAKPEDDARVKELTELTTKVKTFEEKERERTMQAAVHEIEQEGAKLHDEAFSVVDEGLRELGLIADPAKDDERTIRLKNDTADAIRKAVEPEFDGPDGPKGEMDWSLCSEEQKENRKLTAKTIDLLAKQDFRAARDYLDLIRARVDLAFQRVQKAKVELFNAAMLQPTAQTRTAAPGGNERPEIVAGTAATGGTASAKTPWLDPSFIKEGEAPFDAMQRYMDAHDNLPGRA